MTLDLYTDARADDLAWLAAGMRRHETSLVPGLAPEPEDLPLTVIARDEGGRRLGGVKASVYWDGLEIEMLWVDETHRHRGIGSALLGRIESFATEHGAVVAFLKTVDAVEFYRRHGYTVFGVLEDRPIGTCLYHMKKRLPGPGA